jgi:hypothetical protein
LGQKPTPELILQYVYAILYSPPYRTRYADLLRADFPRIPLPPDRGVFLEFAGLGAVLIDLHLLRSDQLREIRDGRLDAEGKTFEGIAAEVWEYKVGGYRVLDRWLAGRAGRSLRWDEIVEFQRIAAALRRTIELQRRIGRLWGVAFQGSVGQE